MGANAQTTVPTFVTSQVLTADQMNQSARTGVPVFADSTARDAAFGGTGEKTLAEGQLAYLEDTNVVQYYDGSSWATVGPSTAGGLVFVTGATFTTATTVSLPDSTFTSTYRNYKVIFQITGVTADADFSLRLRASGADNTTSNYDYGFTGRGSAGGTGAENGIVQTAFDLSESDTNARYYLDMDVLAPQVAAVTIVSAQYGYLNKANTEWFGMSGGGVFRATTAFDALTFISSVASSITGIYRVYGYADS
jgi:hypothetical protein